jgi:hypothetical protein
MSDSKPQPLTEDQRSEVRTLLQQLSEASSARASRRGTNRPLLKTTKKIKAQPNPFEGIDEGQQVEGTALSPDCAILPFIQRTRLVLFPFHYDDITQSRNDWIQMVLDDIGCKLSLSDAGTRDHLRFTVDANPPVRYLHIYLDLKGVDEFGLSNWLYAT